jgi:hypothetical protein
MQVTPEGVPYATTSDSMSVADITAAMATGISEQLAKLAAAGIVNSDAARDELYPTPVQGNTVFRSDLGIRQTYFAAYNGTTNPNGRTPAGWVNEQRIFVQQNEPSVANGGIVPRAGDIWLW